MQKYFIRNKKFKKVLSIKINSFINLFINFLFEEKNSLYYFLLENIDKKNIAIFYDEIKKNIDLKKITEVKDLIYIKNFLFLVFEKLLFINPIFDSIYSRMLLLMQYFEISKIRNCNIINPYSYDFKKHIKKAFNNNIYSKTVLQLLKYSNFYDLINTISIERDLLLNSNAIRMFFFRYSYTNLDINFIELPQEVFFIISFLLSNNLKKKLSYFNNKQLLIDIYDQISLRKISPATPFLLNLRTNRNTASCFIMSMGDSLEQICDTSTSAAKIAKNGGGVGIDFSKIRCRKSYIKNIIGKASGVIPYIKVCNDLMIAFDQLGKRDGALTTALSIWHYDILSFLNLQTEENFDYRFKAFDIFPQLLIHDLFMEYVINNKKWILVDPYEIKIKYKVDLPELYGKEFSTIYSNIMNDIINRKNPKNIILYREINARDLMDIIINTQIHTGLPYIFFKDTVNNLNPNKKNGLIYCGNLCQESFSNFSKINKKIINKIFPNKKIKKNNLAHTCNLLSINLAQFVENKIINYKELLKTIRLSVLILDNIISLSFKDKSVPIFESYLHNFLYRTIGIGFMGLNDLLAASELYYGDEDSIELVDKLFEFISYYIILNSCKLAKLRGFYPMYKNSEWSKGIFFGKNLKWFKNNKTFLGFNKWLNLINKVKKYGLRNGQLIAIAPNSSTSLLNGVSSSVLPIYNKNFLDKNQSGSLFIYPFFFKKHSKFYIPNKDIDNQKIIKLIGKIYKWVDQGISMELVIDVNKANSRLDFFNLIMQIWMLKIKTIYYIRTIQKVDNKQMELISTIKDMTFKKINKSKGKDCDLCTN